MFFLAYSGPGNGGPRSLSYFLGVKIVWKMSLTTCNDHHRSFWPHTVNSGLVFDNFSRKIPLFDLFWPSKWRPKNLLLFFMGWYRLEISTEVFGQVRWTQSILSPFFFSLKMTLLGLFWPRIGPKGVPRPSWWPNVGWELFYYQYQTMRYGKEWFPPNL